MRGGSKQGGGGNEFVSVCGLFLSKNNKIYGRVNGDTLRAIIETMIEADEQGNGIAFFVSEVDPGKGAQNQWGRISMTISKPQEQQNGSRYSRYNRGGQQPAEARPTAPTQDVEEKPIGRRRTVAVAQDKDMEQFLENFPGGKK